MSNIISDDAAEKLLASINIPSRPSILVEIQREKNKKDPDIRIIVQIISKDIALTAALLKTANSPFFGLRKKAESVQQAAMSMGFDNVVSIVDGIALKSAMSLKEAKLERFWDSAEKVAIVAAYLSKILPDIPKEEAYMFGLFRDCGIPIMMQKFPDYKQTLLKADSGPKSSFTRVEDEIHSTNHATLGYLLAKSWSLPSSICLAILNHHDLSILHAHDDFSSEARNLIAIARVAEYLCDVRQLRDDRDWKEVSSQVLSYLGITAGEFEDIKEEVFHYQETV